MTTFIKRILSWILPPEDAQEAAREHLRENVYIANKESIDNPPARDHVGRKTECGIIQWIRLYR